MDTKKVLMTKMGLDGHDFGVKILCQMYRNAGFEVVYTGQRQTAEMVVAAAIEEDVDVIGISTLSGAHMHSVPLTMEEQKKQNIDIPVIVGGTIPPADVEKLKKVGVAEVFPTGTDANMSIEFIKKLPNRKSLKRG
ncbi:MAG: cobalamin B12-binding domain-containing protein [Desulfobacteraceae bacterium]|nr:cobalamin B12-binding domain-containing protein [Desulfobacteraceae bacterium]MBC2756244.1 cobalamin B12-binding domain-containing protein [Desulfobacteraceae bacterium]